MKKFYSLLLALFITTTATAQLQTQITSAGVFKITYGAANDYSFYDPGFGVPTFYVHCFVNAADNTAGTAFEDAWSNSTVTMNLATIFKLKGINLTVSAACASGSHSIGLAYLLIKMGLQQCVIAGGAQEINHLSMGTFDALGAFSIREDDPQKASRPFDKDRDGLIPSGGAATVILESLESAQKRIRPRCDASADRAIRRRADAAAAGLIAVCAVLYALE